MNRNQPEYYPDDYITFCLEYQRQAGIILDTYTHMNANIHNAIMRQQTRPRMNTQPNVIGAQPPVQPPVQPQPNNRTSIYRNPSRLPLYTNIPLFTATIPLTTTVTNPLTTPVTNPLTTPTPVNNPTPVTNTTPVNNPTNALTSTMTTLINNASRMNNLNINTPNNIVRTVTSTINNANFADLDSFINDNLMELFADVMPITFGTNLNNDTVIVRPTELQILNATEMIQYNTIDTSEDRCPIDLTTFNDNDMVMRIRECGHIFRPDNLRGWFRQSVRCPMCRYDIREYQIPENNINNEGSHHSDTNNTTNANNQERVEADSNANANVNAHIESDTDSLSDIDTVTNEINTSILDDAFHDTI